MAKKNFGHEQLNQGRGWRVYIDHDMATPKVIFEIQAPMYGGVAHHQILCPPHLEQVLKAGVEYMALKSFMGEEEG